MRTLVFCTSYATTAQAWDDRQGVWITALQQSGLEFDQLLIVDDASPVLPAWDHVAVIEEREGTPPEAIRSDAPIVLYTHRERLGRQSVFEFPGWYRSFAFGVLYGTGNGFEKIIHLESDAFLVSQKIQAHFNEFRHGWFACWCQAYQFPEIAIQAAAGEEIAVMADFVRRPYAQMAGQVHELIFPFTHIERSFVGNRYGEMIGHVPAHADFSTQTQTGHSASFYWWIPRDGAQLDGTTLFRKTAPFPIDILEGGWSGPEDDFSWMTDVDSSFFLPPLQVSGDLELHITVFPCVYMARISQTLVVLLNERLLASFTLYRQTTLLCPVPAGIIRSDGVNRLQFLHPDAFAPSELGSHAEHRKLSIALAKLELATRASPRGRGAQARLPKNLSVQ